MFIRTCRWTLPLASLIQYTLLHDFFSKFKGQFHVSLQAMHTFHGLYFQLGPSDKNCLYIFHFSHACYMSCPSRSSYFNRTNNIRPGIRIIKDWSSPIPPFPVIKDLKGKAGHFVCPPLPFLIIVTYFQFLSYIYTTHKMKHTLLLENTSLLWLYCYLFVYTVMRMCTPRTHQT